LVFFVNFFIIHLIFYQNELINSSFLLSCMILFFLISILDDLFEISAILKTILFIIFFLFVYILFNDNFLEYLYFRSFSKIIDLGNYKFFLNFLCFFLLINAFNMADGINGLSCSIFLNWLFFLYIYSYFYLGLNLSSLIFFLPFIILFLIYNYKGLVFLGNTGSNLIALYISILSISIYNKNLELLSLDNLASISTENFFLLFLFPGLDLVRLFVYRVFFLKVNFYKGDKNHLHHYMISKFSNFSSVLIYNLLIVFPNLYFFFNPNSFFYMFFVTFIAYILLLYYLKRN